MNWAIPSLNTRETAIAVWVGGLLLVLLIVKAEVREAFASVLRTFFGSALIVGVIGSAAAYAGATVLLLRHFGHWEGDLTKVSVIWFFGFALIALFQTKNVDATYFRRLALHALGMAAVVEFVANLHTFPLPVEMLLVPMALLLAGTQALAESAEEYSSIRKPIAWMLGLIGAASIVFSLVYLGRHFDDVVSADKVEAFFLPFVLTIAFVPYLVALRLWIVYQTTLHMVRAGIDDRSLSRFARHEIVRACGVNLGKVQLFEAEFRGRLWRAESREDVTRVLAQFRNSWAAGRRVKAEQHPAIPG